MFQKTLGLPTLNGLAGKVYFFDSNSANGYGHDTATAPSELVLLSGANCYAPGASNFNISFSMLDARGQMIMGSAKASIKHLVQLLVLPRDADCTSVQSCDRIKLQTTESFLSSGTKAITSLLLDFDIPISLKYCQIGEEEVQVRLFIISGDELDVGGASQSEDGLERLAMLQKSVVVNCSPCEPGWMRIETEGGLWTCLKCSREQYVVDPDKHACKSCPAGGTCEEGTFKAINPADSVWNITSDGTYRITSCPAGYVLIRDENEPVLDRCVACAPDTYSVEESVFGERLWDVSVENYNQYCHPCPRSRAMCSGANDIRPLAGAILMLSSRCVSSACACNTFTHAYRYMHVSLHACSSRTIITIA